MSCHTCSTARQFTVNATRAAQVLTFTVAADQCCMLTDCKMIQSVLLDAICQYIAANALTFPSDGAQLQDKCCGCNDYKHMVWNWASKSVAWTLVGSAAGLPVALTAINVTAPYGVVNT